MRKELIFAIVAGALFGLVIAVGIWRAREALKPEAANTQSTAKPTASPLVSSGLTLASPSNESVIVEATVSVTGITAPNTFVAISSEGLDYVTKSDTSGEFIQEVDLNAGTNEIIVKSFPEGSSPSEETLLLVHSTQLAEIRSQKDPEPVEGEKATDEAKVNDVRQKVQEKIDEVLANPIAYIGNVTDISGKTIQIDKFTLSSNSANGEILQISVTDDTTYAKVDKNTETIDFDEVAIGDFIIAMGTTNGEDVLEASRIIVTDTLEESGRSIVQDTAEVNDDGDIKIKSGDESIVVEISKSTDLFETDGSEQESIDDEDVETGDALIIFFVADGNEELARSIYKLIF